MRLLAAALSTALLAPGCGGDGAASTASGAGGEPRAVVVAAASSLRTAFAAYGEAFEAGTARLSFAGSDALAAQLRRGVEPDVLATATTSLPRQLAEEGLVEAPVVFATNELVLAVPAEDARVASLDDLAGATLAIGARDVPVGDYTRTVLERLPAARAEAVLRGVRSEEPDVAGIVGKLTQGAVDAGFVYRSDVVAAGGRLRAIELPDALQPEVRYAVAVVRGGENPEGARAFVRGLLGGPGRQALLDAGLGVP